MEYEVKSLIGIFTIIDGKIHIITNNNKLFEVECNDNVEIENSNFLDNHIKIENINLKQCYTFSEKKENKLMISILYIDIVDYESIKSNNFHLVPIDNIEKDIYTNKLIEYLKKDLVWNSTIKRIYPNEFVLPEIQKVYEDILDKKYDRRNFRKRLIKLDVIEDLNKISDNKKGRPAKLYRFKDITEDKILF